MQQPSIGRIVHYTNLGDKDGKYPPEIQAAMVTGVYRAEDGASTDAESKPANQVGAPAPNVFYVDLRIFYRSGEFYMSKVPYSEAPERGHWNWPPRA